MQVRFWAQDQAFKDERQFPDGRRVKLGSVLEALIGSLLVCLCAGNEYRIVGVEDFLFEAVVNFGDQGLAKCWRVKVVMLQEEEAVWPMVVMDVSCFGVKFINQNLKIRMCARFDEAVHMFF